MSSPKDRIPDLQRSGVVYKTPCAVCPAAYIGQTGRRLCQRLDEHKRAVKGADFNSSALAEHAWTEGHPVDWQNVSYALALALTVQNNKKSTNSST